MNKINNMVNFLEYLYRPFIETGFIFYKLFLLLFYYITDRKHKSTHIVYNDGQKTKNQYKISESKKYILKNFPYLIKLCFLILIFWFVYKLIISLGLIEIVKLFIN
jgi:hypothetical protein